MIIAKVGKLCNRKLEGNSKILLDIILQRNKISIY